MRKCILLVLFFFASRVLAQTDPISADRPDQTESANIMSNGMWQIETGIVYSSENSDNLHEFSYDLLLRYGLFEKLEIRLNSSFKSSDYIQIRDGITPLTFGMKYKIYDGNSIIPSIGAIAQIQLANLANEKYVLNYNAPSFILILENELTENLSNAANAIVQWDGISDDNYYSYSYSLGYSLSDRANVFIELYGDIYSNATPTHKIDFGATYIINNDWCIDISSGKTLSNKLVNLDYFIGFGSSFRF